MLPDCFTGIVRSIWFERSSDDEGSIHFICLFKGKMPSILFISASVAFCIFVGQVFGDSCAAFTDCKSCAGINGCGWCSTPVEYTNGTSGAHCASPQSTGQFKCNGIYSTSVCLQGYLCDQAAGTCRQALPGQGTDFANCNAACTVGPTSKVYGCQNGSKTCIVVPAGTPGSASREQCEQHCLTPPAKVYKCSVATDKCEVVAAGTQGSSSREVCEAIGCSVGVYGCDLVSLQCSKDGNMTKKYCSENCRAPNDPCEKYKTCAECLAGDPFCGWCSQNVTYTSGQTGGRCAGVNQTILPFKCLGTYSTNQCAPTPPTQSPNVPPTPLTQSPNLPPRVNCPKGSTVLLQYNCQNSTCRDCNTGTAAECLEPHCTLYCSGLCQPVPYFKTSFMWSCNGNPSTETWKNATLVHFLDNDRCTGAVNPPGTGGSGTYPLNTCASPYGPNNPPQYNTFMCVPCGESCDWH